jgi:hypothetical protein
VSGEGQALLLHLVDFTPGHQRVEALTSKRTPYSSPGILISVSKPLGSTSTLNRSKETAHTWGAEIHPGMGPGPATDYLGSRWRKPGEPET